MRRPDEPPSPSGAVGRLVIRRWPSAGQKVKKVGAGWPARKGFDRSARAGRWPPRSAPEGPPEDGATGPRFFMTGTERGFGLTTLKRRKDAHDLVVPEE